MDWHSPVLIPFLTLQCNFNCIYCITKFSPDYNFSYPILALSKWSDFINSTQGISDVIFNGGEPTLFPEFHRLINIIKPLNLIAIGTNYSLLATKSLLQISPREDLILDGSFHPHFISFHDISQNLLELKAAALKVRVHSLDYPGFKFTTSSLLHDFTIQGIASFIQQFEGYWEDVLLPKPSKLPSCSLQERKTVRCSRSIYTPIAPDGNIYFCHYLMYSQTPIGLLGHITDNNVDFPVYLDCPHYGWCSPCDWPRTLL